MNILLINPASNRYVAESVFLAPALGNLRMAGYLRGLGHYTDTYDPNYFVLTSDGPSLEDKLVEHDWDLVGFSILEETIVEDIAHMYLCQRLRPSALQVAGGIEAQFNYQTILDKSPCKIVILGEGEAPMRMIAEGQPLGDIPGVVFRNNALPMPQKLFDEATASISWEDTPYEKYWDYYVQKYGDKLTEQNKTEIHTVRVFSKNRCPIGCKFCSSTNQLTWGSDLKVPVIGSSDEVLLSVIDRIVEAHPRVRTIYFTDDDFCINKKSVIGFCKELVKRNYPKHISFMSFARITDLNDDVLGWLKKGNFRQLNIGIESFSQSKLDAMDKFCTEERIHDVLKLTKKHGIKVYFNIILVTPECSLDDIEYDIMRTREYMSDDWYTAGIIQGIKPLKGTDYYEQYANYITRIENVRDTHYSIKVDDLILADDPLVRKAQIAFKSGIADEIVSQVETQGISHPTGTNLAAIKLNFMESVIAEIKDNPTQQLVVPYDELPVVRTGDVVHAEFNPANPVYVKADEKWKHQW